MNKKVLTIEEQIIKLKEKGIKFNLLSEERAIEILSKSTYFYKIYSYRKNFNYNDNIKEYENLEFKYLYDLSKFDMSLRYFILQMALDIEHGLKRSLISEVGCNPNEINNNELIKKYLISKIIKKNIDIKRKDIIDTDINKELEHIQNINFFNSNLINHKKINKVTEYKNWNIWEFVEVIDFGNLIGLCELYIEEYRYKFCDIDILNKVRVIRNASAHNNCLIDDINRKICFKPNIKLVEFCNLRLGIDKKIVRKRIRTTFVYTFISLIYCYEFLRPYSAKVDKYNELNSLFINKGKEIFDCLRDNNSCMNLIINFDFIMNIIEILYKRYCL